MKIKILWYITLSAFFYAVIRTKHWWQIFQFTHHFAYAFADISKKIAGEQDNPCRVYWGTHYCTLSRGHFGDHYCGYGCPAPYETIFGDDV